MVYRYLVWTAIAIILLVALTLNLLRIYLPGVFNSERPYFEQWAADTTHLPVQISDVRVRWYHLTPMIEFRNVNVLDKNKEPLVQIQRLAIGINLLDSLLKWKLLPNVVVLDGAQLELHQDKNNNFNLESMEKVNGKNLLQQTLNLNRTLTWLLTQGTVLIQNVSMNWTRTDGTSFPITDLNLQVRSKGFGRLMVGNAVVANNLVDRVAFSIAIKHLNIEKLKFDSDIYLSLSQMKVANWAKFPLISPYLGKFTFPEGQGEVQVWMKWRKMKLKLIQGRINLTKLVIQTPTPSEKFIMSDLSANIAWQHYKNGWGITADHIRTHFNDETWLDNAFGFKSFEATDNTPAHQIIGLRMLKLHDFKFISAEWKTIPDDLKQLYAHINLQGTFNNVVLKHEGVDWTAESVKFSADFSRLHADAWSQWPGLSNFSGHFYWSPQLGQLLVKSKNFVMHWPLLFTSPLNLKAFEAKLNWTRHDNQWIVNADSFVLDDTNARIEGSALFSNPATGIQLSINSKFKMDDVGQVVSYLPKPKLDNDLYNWLASSFKGGAISSGTLIFEGSPADFPFAQNQGHFQVVANLKDIDLAFDSDWPMVEKINGVLVFDNASMQVSHADAIIMNNPIDQLNASIPNLPQGLLSVSGNVNTDLHDAAAFLKASPLEIGRRMKFIALQGPMDLGLRLQIPLNQYAKTHSQTEVIGNLGIRDSSLQFIPLNLNFEKLNGHFRFGGGALIAPQVTAELFSEPLTVNINTIDIKNNSSVVQFNIQGYMDMKKLQGSVDEKWLKYFQGAADYQAQWNIHQGTPELADTFSIKSTLEGISIDFDSLYSKPASKNENLNVNISVEGEDKPILLDASLGSHISAALSFSKDAENALELSSGQIALGDEMAQQQTTPGLVFLLAVPTFDWSEWEKVLERYSAQFPTQHAEAPDLLRLIHLKTDALSLFEHKLQKVDLQLQPSATQWTVDIVSSTLSGTIQLPRHQASSVINANLQKLYLPASENFSSGKTDLSKWPGLNISVGDFRYQNRALGSLKLITQPEAGGVEISKFQLTSGDYDLFLSGYSKKMNAKMQTDISGQVKSNNFGTLLNNLNLTKALADADGIVNFSLHWLGSVFSPNVDSISGFVNLNLENGIIVNLSSGAQSGIGLSRMLNLFSLSLLPNLSHLSQRGLNFTVMKGSFKLQNGNAISNNVYLDGPVAKVNAKGRIGYVAKDYDVRMKVRPYVTSSLPTIASVIGGFNPIVGAISWFVNKVVISPAVSRAAQFEYQITGSWQKPTVVELHQSSNTKTNQKK